MKALRGIKDRKRHRVFAGSLAIVVLILVVGPATLASAADPVQVQMTLEGCKLPDGASSCVYPTDFTTGSLGKNWAELDLVPHRLTLNNNGADQTFEIRLSADHLLNGIKGYDFITTPTSSGCTIGVLTSNEVSPTGVVGGVDKVLTTELQVHLGVGDSCAISYSERLAIGSHLYSGASLQSQVLNADYSSAGQRTVSIPVNEIAPQEISKTATAFSTPSYTWTITKTSPTESVDLDSCLAAPTAPNVSYTVTYTRTKHSGDTMAVSGTITLTNPAHRSLVASITDTIKLDGSAIGGGTLPDATVPATGSVTVPYSFSVPNDPGTLSNTASAAYHDPDNADVDLTPLAVTVAVPISPQELPGEGTSAVITDTETASAGLVYQRISPHATSGFVSTDSFEENVSGNGSFSISKIVKAAAPGNFDGTLTNHVSLDPAGDAQAITANAVVPIHVHAANPTLTVRKFVDVAPDADTAFPFTITNEQTDATTPVVVTILAGQTSGSATVTVAPSNAGYTVTEDAAPAGYDASDPVTTGSLALCGSATVQVNDVRSRGSLTITKAISGDDAPPAGFVFHVTCSDGTEGTFTFHAAGSQTLDGIITGSTCDVAEDATPGWTSSPSGTQHVTITTEGATVSFANTRNTGSVSVTKAIVDDLAPPAGFVFHVTCTDGTDETLTFHAAGTQTVDGILSGSTCTITETPVEGWTSTPSGPQIVTLGLADDSTRTVGFTNTRQPAGIKLVKTVDKPTAAYGDTLTYGLTVSNIAERPLHSVEVSDDIPTGTHYVNGSATCSAPCAASFDVATNTVHFAVGDLASGASFSGMTYKVTIDTPAAGANGSIPAGRIVNVAATSAPPDIQGPVLSNEVVTTIIAVLGEKLVRTGTDAGTLLALGIALMLAGVGLRYLAFWQPDES